MHDSKVRRRQRQSEIHWHKPKVKPGYDEDSPLVKKKCLDKRRFTKKRAAAAAVRASKKHLVQFDAYHCRACGNYHIGRRRNLETGEYFVFPMVKREVAA